MSGSVERFAARSRLLWLPYAEVRAIAGLLADAVLLAGGRHRGPGRFATTAGTRAMPIVLLVVIVVETIAGHIALPHILDVPWLRWALLLLNAYAVGAIAAVVLAREAHPHTVEEPSGDLVLHWGREPIARIPSSRISRASRERGPADWLRVAGERADLGSNIGTNVRLLLTASVPLRQPRFGQPPAEHQVREIHLAVDDPDALLAALTRPASPPARYPMT